MGNSTSVILLGFLNVIAMIAQPIIAHLLRENQSNHSLKKRKR